MCTHTYIHIKSSILFSFNHVTKNKRKPKTKNKKQKKQKKQKQNKKNKTNKQKKIKKLKKHNKTNKQTKNKKKPNNSQVLKAWDLLARDHDLS
jgi:hypothetical protein